MFDYTRAAARKIKQDIDKIALGLSISTQLLSILYIFYVLLFGGGSFAVKLTLLLITVAYFVFFCYATKNGLKKRHLRKVTLAFQWSKRFIKLVNLGMIIYGFANATYTTFSLLLVAFSILSWGLDVIIGIISFVMTTWLQLFFTGIEADLEEYKKKITAPFTATGNFFKRMVGKEVEVEQPNPTKQEQLLTEMVMTEREKRALEKQRKKEEKRMEKLAKKKAQRNHAPSIDDEIAPTED